MDDVVARPPLMSERRVALIGALLVALGPVSMSLYTPAMPELVRDFGTTEAVIKLTLSVYFGGFAFAQLIAGPLSDAFGRRVISLVFIVIYLAASIAAALAPQVEVLIAARLVQGIGASVGIATSRAIVRDLFTGERSARIMNFISILLAIGPAIAPTIGGLTLMVASWRVLFAIMVAFGLGLVLVIVFAMRESGHPDPRQIRPLNMLASYGRLLRSAHFVSASLAIGGSIGAFYTMATMLPFIMINQVGLSPEVFGVTMVMQSGSFFAGSLAARAMMQRRGADAIVPIGIAFIGLGAILICVFSFTLEPGVLTVMGPVAFYAFGIAFVIPAMATAAMHHFPQIAGAASALLGFVQMGTGFAVSGVAALFADPVVAIGLVVPAMGAVTAAGYLFHRRVAGRTPRTAEPRGRLLP